MSWHHTDEAKAKIACSMREQFASGRRTVSPSFRNLGGYRIPEERRARMRGRLPWNKAQVKVVCPMCGFEILAAPSRNRKFCSTPCALRYRSVGGEYDLAFNYTLRKRIRERDGNRCRVCGILNGKRVLVIHHLDYDKANSDLGNLVTLCRTCHLRGHRSGVWPIELSRRVSQ